MAPPRLSAITMKKKRQAQIPREQDMVVLFLGAQSSDRIGKDGTNTGIRKGKRDDKFPSLITVAIASLHKGWPATLCTSFRRNKIEPTASVNNVHLTHVKAHKKKGAVSSDVTAFSFHLSLSFSLSFSCVCCNFRHKDDPGCAATCRTFGYRRLHAPGMFDSPPEGARRAPTNLISS